MGATELQIFVSLVVVLGAAFVALICDFLKGSNERLREANLELQVRQDHLAIRTAPAAHAVAVRAPAAPAVVAAESGREAAREMAAAHRPVRRAQSRPPQLEDWTAELIDRQIPLPAGLPAAAEQAASRAATSAPVQHTEPLPAVPGLSAAPEAEPTRAGLTALKEAAAVTSPNAGPGEPELPAMMAAAPAAPALRLNVEAPDSMEREPALAELVGIETSACRPAPSKPMQLAAAALASAQERSWPPATVVPAAEPPLAGIAALPGSLPILKQATPAPIPGATIRPEDAPQIPAAADALSAAPPMAQDARIELGLPALHEFMAQVSAEPAAAAPAVPNPPRFAPPAQDLSPGEAGLIPILPGLPLHGQVRAGAPVTPVFESGSAAVPASSAPASRELAPGMAQTLAGSGPAPARSGAQIELVALSPSGSGAAPAMPAISLSLDSALPDAAAAYPPATGHVVEEIEEADAPVVRIRVLREDALLAPEEPSAAPEPIVAGKFTQLQDLFAAPVEAAETEAPMPAGPVEQPIAALDSSSGSLPLMEPRPPAPAWAAEPAIPRDKVVELPLHPPAAQTVRTLPVAALLDVPRGWHDARTLQHLAAAPLPFEGLVACVSITDYARLVQEYGAGRCEEAFNSLGLALESLAQGSTFLCRASEDEIVILFPNLHASEHPARVRLLAEVLWDYQLRTLAFVPVLCGWGAAESLREPLAAPLARARAQMSENQRLRKGGSSALGRFRRRVVNG